MPQDRPNVFTYPRQEPGTLGHLDLVEPLRAMPKAVADAVRGLTEAQLRWRPSDHDWCINEVVGHLRDACDVFHRRLYMMSTQTDPLLAGYDYEAAAPKYATMDIAEILDAMGEFREDTVQLLISLVNWNWARTGQHPFLGRMSIRQMVEYMIDHENEHVERIRRLRVMAPD